MEVFGKRKGSLWRRWKMPWDIKERRKGAWPGFFIELRGWYRVRIQVHEQGLLWIQSLARIKGRETEAFLSPCTDVGTSRWKKEEVRFKVVSSQTSKKGVRDFLSMVWYLRSLEVSFWYLLVLRRKKAKKLKSNNSSTRDLRSPGKLLSPN